MPMSVFRDKKGWDIAIEYRKLFYHYTEKDWSWNSNDQWGKYITMTYRDPFYYYVKKIQKQYSDEQ